MVVKALVKVLSYLDRSQIMTFLFRLVVFIKLESRTWLISLTVTFGMRAHPRQISAFIQLIASGWRSLVGGWWR